MFGIQTSELVVIALIAILLFGPERVPEFFHKAGQLISKLQRSADDLWTSLQTEMNETKKPLEDVGKEIKAIGDSLANPLDKVDREPGSDPEPESGDGDGPEEPTT